KTRKGYVEVTSDAAPAAATEPKAKAKPAPAAALAPAALVVTHAIDLDPTDWFVATWRRLDPLPRPAAQPPSGPPLTVAQLKKEIRNVGYDPHGKAFAGLLHRCPPADLLETLINNDEADTCWLVTPWWLNRHVIPYLSIAERESLRAALRKRLVSQPRL